MAPSVGVSIASSAPWPIASIHLVQMSADRRCDEQDRARRFGHDLTRRLDAVDSGHEQIHQDQVRPILARRAIASPPSFAIQAT